MTEQQLVQAVHRLYEKNTDYPDPSSEDYGLIRGFLNDAIEAWGDKGKEASTKWRELFTTLSVASDGDKVTVNGQAEYDAPSDFVEISSFVEVDGQLYSYLKPDKVLSVLNIDPQRKFYYITGSGSTQKIVLNPAPTVDGVDIKYSYYKRPSLLADEADVIEMKKPYFAIYFAVSSLTDEERPDLAGTYLVRAGGIIDEMVIDNELTPFGHSFALEDYDFEITNSKFGV